MSKKPADKIIIGSNCWYGFSADEKMPNMLPFFGLVKGGDPGAMSQGPMRIGTINETASGVEGARSAPGAGDGVSCELWFTGSYATAESQKYESTVKRTLISWDHGWKWSSDSTSILKTWFFFQSNGADRRAHGGGEPRQMNMRGIFLHVFADAMGSVIVVVSALVIWQTEWEYR